jgi:arylsulfatase A-like enzyme
VVVLTDDQRWDTVDGMPHLLADVADRGARFTNAFATTPICAPSRASIYSGLYAHRHGVVGNGGRFEASLSFAGRLRAAGYRTGLVGKYLLGSEGLGTAGPDGWDDYYGIEWFDNVNRTPMPALRINDGGRLVDVPGTEHDEATDRFRDRALDFVRAHASRPFFLLLATTAPHAPAAPAKRHLGAFAGAAPWRPPSWHEEKIDDKPGWVQFLAATARKQPDPKVAIERGDRLRERQLESLLGVDDAIGALSDALEELGLGDDTVFVFTSDNGHHWGEHWSLTKFSAYEESIRIPLLVRYPRLAPLPRSVPDLALNIDLAPTFLALAGLPPLPDADGTSLAPVLAGGSLGPRAFLIESSGDFITRPSEAIRTERWKLIRSLPPHSFEELYDLEHDPYELENLASRPEHAAIRSDLGERLERLRSKGGGSVAGALPRDEVPAPPR